MDVRTAWRSLARQPGAAALVVGLLALGIGANVAIFSLINGLFLRPFPFVAPDRLVYVNETAPRWNLETTGVNYPDFWQWQQAQQAFDALALFDPTTMNVAVDRGADRLEGLEVTADFPRVLGVQPALGRFFTPDEDRPGAPDLVVIGYGLWQERFAGRADVLGGTLRLNSRPHTIIGVLPREADFPGRVRFWVAMKEDHSAPGQNYSAEGLGRLKPGLTVEAATADLVRAHQPIFDARDRERIVTPFARGLREHFAGEYRTGAATLVAAVALLLVIACANVASMMLARALARRREIGIRTAVGASRARLLRQLFVENVLLSAAGGALGLGLGVWASGALLTAVPDQAPAWTTFALDARMMAFTVAVSVATALLFGLAPAVYALRVDLRTVMTAAAAGSTAPVRGRRTLQLLVGAEFALAAVMFVSAGLLVRAYERVQRVDPGFNPSGVLTFTLNLPGASYPNHDSRLALFTRLEERLRSLPGVTEAGLVTCAPLSGCHWGRFFTAEGQTRGPDDPNPVVLFRLATPGYVRAMGLRLKAGRFFDASDRAPIDRDNVVIVNDAFARAFWPDGRSPVGARIQFGRGGPDVPWLTVVGHVEDVRHYGLEEEMRPGVYAPALSGTTSAMTVALRTTGDPALLAAPARGVLQALDPELPIYGVRTMEERLAQSRIVRALYTWLLGVFAAVALVLALGGTYGVTSYLASQRRREFGIRLALGARGGDILRAVLQGSGLVIVAGTIAGIGAALGAGPWLSSLLFGVPPYDAVVIASAVLALALTAALATWLPARRAARIDPVRSLRTE